METSVTQILPELIAGCFGVIVAVVAGVLKIYDTRMSKRLDMLKKKSEENNLSIIENNILEQIVPVLEKKDEALDKIAEILENLCNIQELQNQRIKQIEIISKEKCQAPLLVDVLKAVAKSEKERRDAET